MGTEQEELRDREALYRAMFELNTAIKLLIDPHDGTVVDANPAAAAFYGWPLPELRGMSMTRINVLDEPEVRVLLERARTSEQRSFHFQHRTATGAIREVDVFTGPVVLRGRELLLSIVQDVTARVALEADAERSHRLDALGQLAAGVAHDVNNALALALTSLERAERRLAADHDARADLADARQTVQQTAALTRQMLAFARHEAPAVQLTDVGALIRRVVAMLQRVLEPRIAVIAQLPEELPPIRVNPGRLELAFINLALNARDAMAGGGVLDFRAARDGGFVHVVVGDTGPGMDEETRARAFEPFFSTKPPGIGTGLGLATVHNLIEQADGRVWIDSAPGDGTRVHLELPMAIAPIAVPRATKQTKAMRSVLIVDDRADVRRALETALEVSGLAVYTAASAAEALTLLGNLGDSVDVVLSDMAMPVRSGLDLALDVRARWPAMPVVLMSGAAGRPASPDVAAWLDKPFTLDDVIEVLDRVSGDDPTAS